MSDVVLVSLITTIGVGVPATIAAIASFRGAKRAAVAAAIASTTKRDVEELTIRVDGRLTELLTEVRERERAEGIAAERAVAAERAADQAKQTALDMAKLRDEVLERAAAVSRETARIAADHANAERQAAEERPPPPSEEPSS